MKLRKRALIPAAVVAGLVLLLSAFDFRRPEFRLADSTAVAISGISAGRQLRMFHGEDWQWPFYKLLHRNFSSLFKSVAFACQSGQTNGSVAVAFRRVARQGSLPTGQKGSLMLAVQNSDGTETWCNRRTTQFKSRQLDGKTRVVAEHILWELPPVSQRRLSLRLYCWDPKERQAVFKEFIILNPLAHDVPAQR